MFVMSSRVNESTSDFFHICFCNYVNKNYDQLFKVYYLLYFRLSKESCPQFKDVTRDGFSGGSNGREDIFLCYYSPILCSDNNVIRLNRSSVMSSPNQQTADGRENEIKGNKIKTV